jgi:colanic acid biosynthesis glycosyl transferase WcaI
VRILIYGINYAPELTGIGKYTSEMCEYFTKRGHEVTMITGFPYYPEWKIPEKYRNKIFLKERHNGVTVKRSYLYVPSKVTTKKRILHEMTFILSSFVNLITTGKPDILIAISPPLGLGLTAYMAGKLKRVPFVFHVQDLQPDAARDLGMLGEGAFTRLLYKIENYIYERASLVSTISGGMRRRIILKGINPEKMFFFSNWVDTDFIRPLEQDNIFRKVNGLAGKFLIVYSGNIGIKQGLDTILEIADRTRDMDDIVYLFVGNGAYKESLFKKYKKMALNNVKFLPVQPRDMLPYMLSAADISLVPQQKTVTDIVMPSKLISILASGRAVIASAKPGSEVFNVIKANGCGIVVEPENPEQLFMAVIDLYNNRNKAEEYGRKGRKYATENLSKESILKTFEERIAKIIAEKENKRQGHSGCFFGNYW